MNNNFISNMVNRHLGLQEVMKPELGSRFEPKSNNSNNANNSSLVNSEFGDNRKTESFTDYNRILNEYDNSSKSFKKVEHNSLQTNSHHERHLQSKSESTSGLLNITSNVMLDEKRINSENNLNLNPSMYDSGINGTDLYSNTTTAVATRPYTEHADLFEKNNNLAELAKNSNSEFKKLLSQADNTQVNTEQSPAVIALLNQIREETQLTGQAFNNNVKRNNIKNSRAIQTETAYSTNRNTIQSSDNQSQQFSSQAFSQSPLEKVINVNIGRIDIRASQQIKAPIVKQQKAVGVLSLNDYLQLRKGEQR